MPRLRPIAMLVAFLLPTLAQFPTIARAADLDHPYRASHGHRHARHLVRREVVVVHDRPFIAEVPIPVHVGGAFVYVPGLNGPDGAPVYPLLPFSFGYGY